MIDTLRHYRMPAEWEPHEATWLAWPHNRDDWPGKFEPIPWVFAEIIRHLHGVEKIHLLVADEEMEVSACAVLNRVGIDLSHVRLVHIPTNRVWTRDFCPIFLKAPTGEIGMTDWRFNAWAKYDDWQLDDSVPTLINDRFNLPCWRPVHRDRRVVLEGGSIDVSGQGLLLTTEECLLSTVQQRNPGFSKADLEKVFATYLGPTTPEPVLTEEMDAVPTSSEEFVAAHAALPTEGFVRRAYRAVLGREPDPQGMLHYSASLGSGAMDRRTFTDMLLRSPEFADRAARLAAAGPQNGLPTKLNLGCGFDKRPGYLNVDFQAFHSPDLVADIRNLDTLPSDTFEEILGRRRAELLHAAEEELDRIGCCHVPPSVSTRPYRTAGAARFTRSRRVCRGSTSTRPGKGGRSLMDGPTIAALEPEMAMLVTNFMPTASLLTVPSGATARMRPAP